MDWFNKLFIEEAKHALNHTCSGSSGSGGSGGGGYTADDALQLLFETGVVVPMVNKRSVIITDSKGNICCM